MLQVWNTVLEEKVSFDAYGMDRNMPREFEEALVLYWKRARTGMSLSRRPSRLSCRTCLEEQLTSGSFQKENSWCVGRY
jgi:hypothetical protein